MTISHAAVGSLQLPATPHTESLPPWQTWMSQGAYSQASGQLLQSPCGHGPTPESGNTRTAVGQASTATRRNSTIPSAAYRATRQPRSTSPQYQAVMTHILPVHHRPAVHLRLQAGEQLRTLGQVPNGAIGTTHMHRVRKCLAGRVLQIDCTHSKASTCRTWDRATSSRSRRTNSLGTGACTQAVLPPSTTLGRCQNTRMPLDPSP